jgi:hypothetical protein
MGEEEERGSEGLATVPSAVPLDLMYLPWSQGKTGGVAQKTLNIL